MEGVRDVPAGGASFGPIDCRWEEAAPEFRINCWRYYCCFWLFEVRGAVDFVEG